MAPSNNAVLSNRGNVLLDTEDGVRGEQVFARLVRAEPRNPEFHRQLARSLTFQGKKSAAAVRLRQALTLKRDNVDPWLDLIGIEVDEHNIPEAEALVEKALAVLPDHPKLLEAKVIVMRRAQLLRRAEAFLMELTPRFEGQAWLHYQLGCTLADYDRERGNEHLRKALALDPAKNDHLMALIESLERTRIGDEGANIEEAYQLTLKALDRNLISPGYVKILFEVLVRACAFDAFDRVCGFATRAPGWSKT